MKTCTACEKDKDSSEFHQMKSGKDGLRPNCKECQKATAKKRYDAIKIERREQLRDKTRKWREKNPDKAYLIGRKGLLKHRYGLTLEAYEAMLSEQGHKCKICETHEPDRNKLNVDHDHKTGKVRGILCRNCNKGLGYFKDSPVLFVRILQYLSESDS